MVSDVNVYAKENDSLLGMRNHFKKSCNSKAEQEVDSQILEVNVKNTVNFIGGGTSAKNMKE